MARYINEDEFVAWVKEHWCSDCQNDNGLRCRACWIDDAIDIVEEAPEADVVPKSEVENLKAIIADHKASEERLEELYSNAKADVAREIFAELETKAPWFCENQTAYENFNEELAELKKKYTEGDS